MIIGLSGKKGSGKNTVSELIRRYSLPAHWEEKQFAGKLKQMVSVLTGITMGDLDRQEVKEATLKYMDLGTTPRYLLQTLGTEWGRNLIDKDIWVKTLLSDYKRNSDWIITDVRFENEAMAIKERGGLLIRINRGQSPDEHSSETMLDNYDGFDYVIDNNGTWGELTDKVHDICVNHIDAELC